MRHQSRAKTKRLVIRSWIDVLRDAAKREGLSLDIHLPRLPILKARDAEYTGTMRGQWSGGRAWARPAGQTSGALNTDFRGEPRRLGIRRQAVPADRLPRMPRQEPLQ